MRATLSIGVSLLILLVIPAVKDVYADGGGDNPGYGGPPSSRSSGRAPTSAPPLPETLQGEARTGAYNPGYDGEDVGGRPPRSEHGTTASSAPPLPRRLQRESITGDEIVSAISESSLFTFAAGFASIVGLVCSIHAMQLSSLPPSLYKSMEWKRTLMFSVSLVVAVISGCCFYNQDMPPPFETPRGLYEFLHGHRFDAGASGTMVWVVLFVLSTCVFIVSLLSSPFSSV